MYLMNGVLFMSESRKWYSMLYVGLSIIHVIMFAVFWLEHCPILCVIHAISVAIYLILSFTNTKILNNERLLQFSMIEICTVASLSDIMAGWNCGFMMYVLGMIPIAFYVIYQYHRKNIKLSIIWCAIFIVFIYTTLIMNYNSIGRIYILKYGHQRFLFVMNMTLAVVTLMGFSFLTVVKVEQERRKLQQEYAVLEDSANCDNLTKLLNRRTLDTYFDLYLKRAKAERMDFSVLMCDLDNFKHVNDTYGHEFGDEILKMVASTIKANTRAEDCVFRWGGEEILLLIDGKHAVGKKIAERCREAIEKEYIMHEGTKISVTITIGGCSYYQGVTKDIMLAKADEHLYEGKQAGKNRVIM